MRILIAKPRGFCAGVDRAIDVVEAALEIFGPPVYMRHQIVHNRYIVEQLEKKGAVFVEKTADIPEGANVVFSAHGVSQKVREEAKQRNLKVIDATCPLVMKVHFEVGLYAQKGYSIILIGHKGHVEMEGTIGEAPEAVTLIETIDEAKNLEIQNPERCIILTQTTLSLDDTSEIISELKKRFPNIIEPPKEDICYATTNRQIAVKNLAKKCQLILAIGSPESSNTNRLREAAEKAGALAHLIQRAADIKEDWLENIDTVGITAGASAPEELVTEVVDWLKKHGGGEPEELVALEENVRFTLPADIIDKARETGKAQELLEKHTLSTSS